MLDTIWHHHRIGIVLLWVMGIILAQAQHRAVRVQQLMQTLPPRQQRPVRSANVYVRRVMVAHHPVHVQRAQAEPIKPARATVRVHPVEQVIIVPVGLRVWHVHHIAPTPQQLRPLHPVLNRVYVWRDGI